MRDKLRLLMTRDLLGGAYAQNPSLEYLDLVDKSIF